MIVKHIFRIGLFSLIGLVSSMEMLHPLNPTDANDSIEPLPTSQGIRIGNVQYIRAEKTPDALLEQAILKQLNDYDECSGDPAKQVRYFYNRTDLNDDGKLETVVYLVGSYTCGSGGCNALIFRSLGSDYQLISDLTLVNNPIVISNEKTKGWRDIYLYVAGGGIKGEYHLLRFNGSRYPSNPSVEPSLPSGSIIAGKAIVADRIQADTPAPVLRPENCRN